jgi:DNA-binding transcriptional LysR family regulator
MEGQGLALAWRHLTGRLIASGLLQKVTGHSLATGAAFHVIWPKGRTLTPQTSRVLEWLTAEGRKLND